MRAVARQFMNSHVGHSQARWSAIEVRQPALLGRPSAPTNLTTERASRNESRARRPTRPAERAEPATPQNYGSRELFKRENGAVLSLLKLAAAVTHSLEL